MINVDISLVIQVWSHFWRSSNWGYWQRINNDCNFVYFKYLWWHSWQLLISTRERTIIGSVSYRNRYWVYQYRIISATVVSADITCITAGSSTVDGSHYTRWSKGVQATARPVTRPPRAHACVLFYGPWYGRGLEGREAEGDCNLIQASPWHKDRAVLVLATIMPHSLHQQEVITTVSCQSL